MIWAGPGIAQEGAITLGDDGSLTTRTIQLFVLITILSIVPGIAIMVTCFPFIVTVLAILRQAIGLQQSPPNMVCNIALAVPKPSKAPPLAICSWAGLSPWA
ncbi:hypothetical protein [uncultured Maritalea sp.]|uniref:hypothetical protein n=1 Tax=uncultured Maritalea sp. TaxID=757249 RepID=UPI00345CA798